MPIEPCRLGRWAAAAALVSAASAAGAAQTLDFDRTFNDRAEPARSHLVADYRAGNGAHRLELWRDGEQHLKRRTDAAIETYAHRATGAVEWSMSVLDLERRIRTDIDRSNLYRIGRFSDWFGMAHALARPKGDYQLTPLARKDQPRLAAIAPCRWYRLAQGPQGSQVSKLCWSEAERVPLLITDAADAVRWRVAAIDRQVPLSTFTVSDAGFVRNDANADIQTD